MGRGYGENKLLIVNFALLTTWQIVQKATPLPRVYFSVSILVFPPANRADFYFIEGPQREHKSKQLLGNSIYIKWQKDDHKMKKMWENFKQRRIPSWILWAGRDRRGRIDSVEGGMNVSWVRARESKECDGWFVILRLYACLNVVKGKKNTKRVKSLRK